MKLKPMKAVLQNQRPADRVTGLATCKSRRQLVAICILTCALCLPAYAQHYAIAWSTTDGGGGVSNGGRYSLGITIGQPDATSANLFRGPFSLLGGFWSGVDLVQTPYTPTLTITPVTANQVLISWTPNAPGWVLQETASLSAPNWENASSGSSNPVTVTVSGSAQFFRLHKSND